MSNCERIEGNLIAYLDAKAGPAERRQVEAHLAECVSCRERAAEFRTLWGVLDELPAIDPSATFDAAMRARIAADPARHAWWQVLAPSPRLAFATTALIALSIWMVSLRQAPAQLTEARFHAPEDQGDFGAILELQTLENYDVLANFDALSELPTTPPASANPAPAAPAETPAPEGK